MKRFFPFLVFLLSSGVLFASVQTFSHPPKKVTAQTVYKGAQLSWDYSLPDTSISYNDGKAYGIWAPEKANGQYQALGVVFDLTAFPGATLEEIDFAHFSRGKVAGPYLYNVYLFDMDTQTTIAVIDSLTAGDAKDTPRIEVGVALGSLPAHDHVGVFIGGLTEYTDGSKTYLFPALMTDSSAYVPGVNYYCLDASDPFLSSDPDNSNTYELNLFDAGATNFVLDLWINLGNGKQMVTASGTTGFKIFRGATDTSLTEIAYVEDVNTYLDTSAPEDSSYFYGVSAVTNGVSSPATKIAFTQPPILTVAEAVADANSDFIPDLLGQDVYMVGQVNSPNFGSNAEYYVQGAQAGLKLYSGSVQADLQAGDSVFVHGTIAQYKGLSEITVDSAAQIQVVGSRSTPDTSVITLAELGEAYEGRLVQVNNVHIVDTGVWPSEGSNGYDVYVTNGTDTVKLFIDKDTDLDGWTPPSEDFKLVAIVDQNTSSSPANDGYSLRPRYQTDFMGLVGIKSDKLGVVRSFSLKQNYPNPFNPTTVISYFVGAQNAAPVQVQLVIYNMLGQKVRTLVNGEQQAGLYSVTFDASGLASGIYIYRITTDNGFSATRKMILLR